MTWRVTILFAQSNSYNTLVSHTAFEKMYFPITLSNKYGVPSSMYFVNMRWDSCTRANAVEWIGFGLGEYNIVRTHYLIKENKSTK